MTNQPTIDPAPRLLAKLRHRYYGITAKTRVVFVEDFAGGVYVSGVFESAERVEDRGNSYNWWAWAGYSAEHDILFVKAFHLYKSKSPS